MQFWIGNVFWKLVSRLSLFIQFTSWILNRNDIDVWCWWIHWIDLLIWMWSGVVQCLEAWDSLWCVLFLWLITNLCRPDSFFDPDDAAASSSHFPYFLSFFSLKFSENNFRPMFNYSRTQNYKTPSFFSISIQNLSWYYSTRKSIRKQTDSAILQISQVSIYTPHPEHKARSRPLCETSITVDGLRRGGRYHGVHAWPVSLQVITSV